MVFNFMYLGLVRFDNYNRDSLWQDFICNARSSFKEAIGMPEQTFLTKVLSNSAQSQSDLLEVERFCPF